MGSTTTSHCWRGRNTSIYANLPQAEESSEHMFDFVFGDHKFPSNISSRESVAVVSGLPREEVCGAEIGDVFGKPKNDISIFAIPLPEFVLEQRQRRISKHSEASSTEPQHPTCTIIEEGREWYGYRDEGIRQAAEMFGVTEPWIRPSSGTEDVDADKMKGTEEKVKKGRTFWHGNGRKVGVEQRWMCVGDDEFGICEELVVVDEGLEEGSVDSGEIVGSDCIIIERDEDSKERPWWSVRWKNVFMKLGCGVLA